MMNIAFTQYWRAYKYEDEANDATKTDWTAATLRNGIVAAALRGLATISGASIGSGTLQLEELVDGIIGLSEPLIFAGLRFEVIACTRPPDPRTLEKFLAESEDRSREAVCLCILPTSELCVYPPRGGQKERAAARTVALYPRDIDALATGKIELLTLLEHKLIRRIIYDRPDSDTQGLPLTEEAASILNLAEVPAVLAASGEDHSDWVEHPKWSHVQETLCHGRDVLLVGQSSSGKSILALQVARSMALADWEVRYLNMGTVYGAPYGLAAELFRPSINRRLLILDDLQSNPSAAHYVLALASAQARATTAEEVRVLSISWNDYASEAVLWHEGCKPVPVSSHELQRYLGSRYISKLADSDIRTLISSLGGDVLLLRLALDRSVALKRRVTLAEVAEQVWLERTHTSGVDQDVAKRVALVAGSLARYDMAAPLHFLMREASVRAEDIDSLSKARLLRTQADSFTLGHRSLAGLLVDWLDVRGGWDSLGRTGGPRNSGAVVLDFLRSMGSSLALESLRAIHARVGFKERPRLNRRAAALVGIWQAFNAVVERMERQQQDDPTWGRTASSAMFAVQTLAHIGKKDAAALSLNFLRSVWSLVDSNLIIDVSKLSTVDDFEKIKEKMTEEDRRGPGVTHYQSADTIDINRFHQSWVSGLILCAEAESHDTSSNALTDAVELQQLPSGAFYPERVPWSTARVLIGLAACGRTYYDSTSVKKAVEWLLRPVSEGGAWDQGLWNSGTGTWNSTLETTAMVLVALSAVGLDCTDARLAQARDYLVAQRTSWTAPGRELDGALALQAYLDTGGLWDEVADEAQQLSLWARGEALWNQATLSAKQSRDQSCRVSQIASHLVSVGWTAIRADLPGFLEALALPARFREEIEAGGASTRSDIPAMTTPQQPDGAWEALRSLTRLSLSDCTIVGNYRRFDERVRHQLRDWRQRIVKPLTGAHTTSHENFLIWAAPGSGKSFLIQEIARELGDAISYFEINLARLSRVDFIGELDLVRQAAKPVLVLVDEIDARADEKWPYEEVFSLLDINLQEERAAVFVLVGSGSNGMKAMLGGMTGRSKGSDLLDRVPVDRRFEIPGMRLEDRAIVFTSQVAEAARRRGTPVAEVEKLAVYYSLVNQELRSPRQLRDLAVSAVQRLSSGESRLKYDDLFDRGDKRNQMFWVEHQDAASELAEIFIKLEM